MNSTSPRTRILVICPHPEDFAPAQRLKYEQYFPAFRQDNFEITVSPFMSRDLCKVVYLPGRVAAKILGTIRGYLQRIFDLLRAPLYDGLYISLWTTPFGSTLFERAFRLVSRRIIYDIDDLVFMGDTSSANRWLAFLKGRSKPIYLMKSADHVITCTPYLDGIAKQHNPKTTDISSTINTATYIPINAYSNSKRLTLGWSGSHTTTRYLQLLGPILSRLAKRLDFRFLAIGAAYFEASGFEVEMRPWTLANEVLDLQEIDIGLYPMPDELWVQGKSGLKALQYMALAIPTVATAVGANFRVIEDCTSGFLVRTNDEWEDRILRLAGDPELRKRIGIAARERVERHYSVHANTPSYLSVWNSTYRS